ncbi:LysR substrate-binding domain-containing protein [Streptomyces sp. KL116D]|uniref:LysR substrate-binding domain-containing protein n=1 Tax=Streptomyces sp. KL116D TaxID=3045152 RepID=UPI003558F37A
MRTARGARSPSVPLSDEEFVPVASPAWAERIGQRPPRRAPAALHGVPLVSYAEDSADRPPLLAPRLRQAADRHSRGSPCPICGRLECRAVVGGSGFSVLPRYLCAPELASGALVLLTGSEDAPINTGFLVQRPGSSTNSRSARTRPSPAVRTRGVTNPPASPRNCLSCLRFFRDPRCRAWQRGSSPSSARRPGPAHACVRAPAAGSERPGPGDGPDRGHLAGILDTSPRPASSSRTPPPAGTARGLAPRTWAPATST